MTKSTGDKPPKKPRAKKGPNGIKHWIDTREGEKRDSRPARRRQWRVDGAHSDPSGRELAADDELGGPAQAARQDAVRVPLRPIAEQPAELSLREPPAAD